MVASLQNIEDVIFYTNYEAADARHAGSCSFNIKGINNQDIGILLDQQKVAIRYGNHCVQPIMKALNICGTIRVSPSFYNTKADIDYFIKALQKAIEMLKG